MGKRDGFIDWMFRSRRTGRITIAHAPNVPLAVWLVATVVNLMGLVSGTPGTVVESIGSAALAIWAVLEIATGVNPFRRSLGVIVLGWMLVTRLALG